MWKMHMNIFVILDLSTKLLNVGREVVSMYSVCDLVFFAFVTIFFCIV